VVARRSVAGVQSARFLGATDSAVTPRSSACWEVAIVYARLGRSCFEHQRAVLVGWPAVLAAAEDALPLNSLSPRKDSAP